MSNTVDHPPHYQHPSGVEAIDICEHLGFNLGNAYKYLARAGKKGDRAEDLRKAAWYLRREIERMKSGKSNTIKVPKSVQNMAREVLRHTKDIDAFGRMLMCIEMGVLGHANMSRVLADCNREAAS